MSISSATGYIEYLLVDAAYRDQGIAGQLLKKDLKN
ncbi:GNAT family N-acetyltransferase [Streptococcus sp.]